MDKFKFYYAYFMNEIIVSLPNIADGEDKTCPLANRIRKNYRHARKWAKRTNTDCFRIYDRDIKEYPLAIDFYAGRFCVQYYSSQGDNEEPPSNILSETAKALKIVFGHDSDAIYWRTRSKRKETRQYEKKEESHEFFIVLEYACRFKVNLRDYLDTGLFLDHRETRQSVARIAKGKRVLNLFAYTCAFSVQAALAGATYTKSVDMSNTYTNWAIDNFKLNSLSLNTNEIIREDCLKFLDQEVRTSNKYDIIVIDPPTISRSKKMSQLFDIHQDYIFLVSRALQLLSEGGVIFFSTNSRRFSFDTSAFEDIKVIEITNKTIPFDFLNQKTHRCWKIGRFSENLV